MSKYQIRNDVITSAQNAINIYSGSKTWFQKLLDILKDGKYARIKLYTKSNFNYDEYDRKEEFTDFVNVETIAYTDIYASFFDIFNHEYMVDFDFEPIAIDKLEYMLTSFLYKRRNLNY